MASAHVVATLKYNKLPALQGQARARAGQVVRKTAFDVEAGAKANSAVDTGAQRNSVYVVAGGGESTYAEAAAAALSAQPGVAMLDEAARPRSDTEAIVAVGVEYGLLNELRRPWLGPAAEAARPAFMAALAEIAKL